MNAKVILVLMEVNVWIKLTVFVVFVQLNLLEIYARYVIGLVIAYNFITSKTFFISYHFQIDHDHCTPNPCENGAPCFNTPVDYYCHCSQDWQGKNCSLPKVQCSHPPCFGNKNINNDCIS